MAALEDVGVLEQVGLEGEHLLDAKRPLLVPGPRKAERLVPGGELERSGPSVGRQGDAEGFQDDALHIVLRLLLGQAERVHLDAVAEATLGRLLDAVALEADGVPELGEGPHLGGLLDEPDAGVHEEADPADDVGDLAGVDLARVTHRVDHADGSGQGVGDLLGGGGPCLLEVVAADVDRVPLRDVAHRVGDHVDDQSPGGDRAVDVGPSRQVLLDDVVLGGAGEHRRVDPLVLGVGDVEGEEPCGGGVDGHRRVHLADGDLVEQLRHVTEVGDRDADLADLAGGLGSVRVVAGLGRQVEGDRQACLPLGQVGAVELVGGGGGGVA